MGQSGKVHATDASDWKLLDAAKVPAKLRQLHAEGYKIVVRSGSARACVGMPC